MKQAGLLPETAGPQIKRGQLSDITKHTPVHALLTAMQTSKFPFSSRAFHALHL